MADYERPVVLVLGDFAHEGLKAKIEALGYTVVNKNLRSGPRNWQRITDTISAMCAEGRLPQIFAYIPTPSLLVIAEEQYDDVREELFQAMERTRCIWFVYEENLRGVLEPLPWEVKQPPDADLEADDLPWLTNYLDPSALEPEEWLHKNSSKIERAKDILESLSERSIEVVPFRKRSDVTIRMFEALDDVESGVFLRVYVPHGRYQSEQFEDFLTIFSRYLREVEGKEFAIDAQRTHLGITYVFRGRGDAATTDDLRAAAKRFDNFLVLAQNDAAAAEVLLAEQGVGGDDAPFIVAKYARSFRRLHLEMRHEFERRHLSLKQQLEAELLDSKEPMILPLPKETEPSALFSVVGNTAPVTINLPAAVVSSGQGNISSFVSGGIKYTSEDKYILELIERISDEIEALRLRSDLDRLKDPSTAPDQRRTAVQKLKALVYRSAKYLAQKADHVGTEVLVRFWSIRFTLNIWADCLQNITG